MCIITHIMKDIKVEYRESAFVELKDYCTFSTGDRKEKGDYLQVTEWSNGEGYDIDISDVNGERHIIITWGQYDAIKACIKAINKSHKTV